VLATLAVTRRAPGVIKTVWRTTVRWYGRATYAAGIGATAIYAFTAFGPDSTPGSVNPMRLIESPETIGAFFRALVWAFFIGAAVHVAWLLLTYLIMPILMLVMIPLVPLKTLSEMVLDAARGAEELKTMKIGTEQDIEQMMPCVKRLLRGIFSPKLLVLTVEHAVWQPVVSRLIALTSVTVVDVTVPTASLLWEIDELSRRPKARVVFIAHQDAAERLLRRAAPESVEAAMRDLLHGQHVLVYTNDRRGLRRFAQGLHTMLEAAV